MDRYAYQSKLRYMNAMEKVCYAFGSILICIALRSIFAACFMLIINSVIICGFGKTPIRVYLHALLLPFTFLVISTVTIILNFSTSPLNGFAIPIHSIYITASMDDIRFALQLFLTALSSVSSLYVLNLTTPMTDIIIVCRKIHVPELFTELMLLIYRFIFVLNVTATSILTAQKSRLSNYNFVRSCQSFGQMGSALFIKAIKRSNALYDAMEARCYDGTIRVLEEEHKAKAKEWFVFILILFFYLCVSLTERFLG